jgi:hypothetical protein
MKNQAPNETVKQAGTILWGAMKNMPQRVLDASVFLIAEGNASNRGEPNPAKRDAFAGITAFVSGFEQDRVLCIPQPKFTLWLQTVWPPSGMSLARFLGYVIYTVIPNALDTLKSRRPYADWMRTVWVDERDEDMECTLECLKRVATQENISKSTAESVFFIVVEDDDVVGVWLAAEFSHGEYSLTSRDKWSVIRWDVAAVRERQTNLLKFAIKFDKILAHIPRKDKTTVGALSLATNTCAIFSILGEHIPLNPKFPKNLIGTEFVDDYACAFCVLSVMNAFTIERSDELTSKGRCIEWLCTIALGKPADTDLSWFAGHVLHKLFLPALARLGIVVSKAFLTDTSVEMTMSVDSLALVAAPLKLREEPKTPSRVYFPVLVSLSDQNDPVDDWRMECKYDELTCVITRINIPGCLTVCMDLVCITKRRL